MRRQATYVAGTLALLALGCAGSGSQSPLLPLTGTTPPPAATGVTTPAGPGYAGSVESHLGGVALKGDIAESALAVYTLQIDPVSLSATSALRATRTGSANDDLYQLSIDSFLRADSLRVRSVSGTLDTIELTYAIEHPFPAPSSPTGTPNGSTNRADLGIAGQVLFLADVADATGNTFFDEGGSSVIANTSLITNADAYYAPAGLLTLSGLANTFPYRSLVDERGGDGSREGISNGGDVTGNFGTNGWTRTELGTGNASWTGYGVLHQGQTSVNTVAFDRAALAAAGSFSLDVAVLAKYNDPRGGANATEKKANRLPPASADASLFAYRMPHGALDVEAVTFESESGGFYTNQISGSTLNFMVTDWDARATETTEADLSLDPSFTNVALGESGLPGLAICIPGVLGDATVIDEWDPGTSVLDDDSAMGGDAGQDTGMPGDELYYTKAVTKTVTSGQVDGTYTGMARATDPEAALVPALTIPLDGSLAPLTSNLPVPVTYQAFTVDLITPNDPPFATVALTSADPMLSGTSASLLINSIGDVDADNLDISVDWGDGNGFVAIATGLASPYTDQSPVGPQMNNADLIADQIDLTIRLDDGFVQVDYPLSYTLNANRAPQIVSGAPVLQTASLATPATFTMDQGTLTVSDPEGDAITYTITNDRNATEVTGATFPIGSLGPHSVGDGTVDFTVYINDANHMGTTGTATGAVTGTVTPALVFNADFESTTGDNNWLGGHEFTPILVNNDSQANGTRPRGYSYFRGASVGYCNVPAGMASSFLTGGMLNTGSDDPSVNPTCGVGTGNWIDDYDGAVDNNIVSPTIDLTGFSSGNLIFDSHKRARFVSPGTNAHFLVYVSTDDGATWGTAISDTTQAVNAAISENDFTVALPAAAFTSSTVRIRFQFTESNTTYFDAGNVVAGWALDNVRILAQ